MKATFELFTPRTLIAALVVGTLALAGCASKTPLTTPAPVENRDTAESSSSSSNLAGGVGAGQTPQSNVTNVSQGNDITGAAGTGRTVYFDFDSFVVKDEFRSVVENNAKVLAANKQKRVMVEGHTDERGGREYNLALGQKRAEAVARAMTLLGAQDNQVEAVSFGKEKPASAGSDEAAWAKNRRAEIKDR